MNQVNKNMQDFYKYNEMISTERRINRISDDPAGLAASLRHRGNAAAFEQYNLNVRDAEEYLRATDRALNQIQDLLIRAREIAESAATETTSVIEKEIAADQIQELINEAIGIANSKSRDRYLFAGTSNEFPAYSLGGRILTPLASTGNEYNDLVSASGSFDGTGEFIIRFVQGGDVGEAGKPTTAMYQISSDGGQSWSDAKDFTNLSMPITDSEGNETGLFLDFQAGRIGEGDEFRLQVVPGRYLGDNGHVEFNNNMFSRINTNVNGIELFEETGIFDTLYRLKNALTHGNNIEISEALGTLNTVQTDMQRMVVSSGMTLSRLQITKNNLTALQENVIDSIQNIEKVDVFEVLTRFAMAENALISSVAALSKVFPRGLLSYI
jgi:flagellin-like hook-associated protein FlgL